MKHPLSKKTKTKITGLTQDSDIQPNAVDLRVDKVLQVTMQTFVLSEDKKTHRASVEVPTRKFQDENDWWCLQPGFYQVVFENKIKVAKSEAGFVISRSTLIRNGVYLLSGLYDSGYEGDMVAGLHVTTAPFYLKKGTRLGQYLNFDAEMLKMYDGSYAAKVILKRNSDYNKRREKKAKGLTKTQKEINEQNLLPHPPRIKYEDVILDVNSEQEEEPVIRRKQDDNKPVVEKIKDELAEIKGVLDN